MTECAHEWVDATELKDRDRRQLCALCGAERSLPRHEVYTFVADGQEQPRPTSVGVHHGRLIHDEESYPVTVTVHEDGSLTIHSEGP